MLPLYFIGFLAMLAASVLLYVSGLATTAVTRRPLPALVKPAAASALQAAGLALLWINFGVGWVLYFNVYVIHVDMAAVSDAAFHAFARGYTRRLPIVVLPFGAMCLVWSLLLWSAPGRLSRRTLWGIATMTLVSLVSTPWAAGAQDDFHDHGYSDQAFAQLQAAHLVRTLAVSIAAVWALVDAWRAPLPARD